MTGMTKTARLTFAGLAVAGAALLALWPMPVQARYQCWWADGDRHCANIKGGSDYYDRQYYDYDRPRYYRPDYDYYRPHHHHGYYLPYYGYHRIYRPLRKPEGYWAGSQRWWRSMEVWGRTGGNAHTP